MSQKHRRNKENKIKFSSEFPVVDDAEQAKNNIQMYFLPCQKAKNLETKSSMTMTVDRRKERSIKHVSVIFLSIGEKLLPADNFW